MEKIDIIGIAAINNKLMTQWMQACDVFEPFKVVAEKLELHYVVETDEIFDIRDFISKGLEFAKAEFGDKIVYAHIQSVQRRDVKILNKSVIPIVDPEISVISDGKKWGLVVDEIKNLCDGLLIEEGEIRKIKSMSWPQHLTEQNENIR